jgi:ABC-type Fe3+ transport system permease subunit
MSVAKKIIGSIVALVFGLVTLLSVYQVFRTGNLQWLVVTLLSLGITSGGLVLAIGSITLKEFFEGVMEMLTSFTP